MIQPRTLLRAVKRRARYTLLRTIGNVAFAFGKKSGPLRGVRTAASLPMIWNEDGALPGAPPVFVLELTDASVFSDYGVVISSSRHLIAEVSPSLGGPLIDHEALHRSSFPEAEQIYGRAALVSSHAHQRYFHWLFDVLPRIEILRASRVPFDKLIVNGRTQYQRESLAAMGIAAEQRLEPHGGKSLAVQKLIVPSLPGRIGEPTLRSLRFLRHQFSGHASKGQPFRLLYVSRNDAESRRVRNEEDIFLMLEARGFEFVLLDGLALSDQVRLFSEADLVVGPHGAGLSNVAFMQSSARGLIEFMPTTYVHRGFERICALLELPYSRLEEEGSGAPHHDIKVSISRLEKLISSVLSSTSCVERSA